MPTTKPYKVLKRKAVMIDADQIQTESPDQLTTKPMCISERMHFNDDNRPTLDQEIERIQKCINDQSVIRMLAKPNIKSIANIGKKLIKINQKPDKVEEYDDTSIYKGFPVQSTLISKKIGLPSNSKQATTTQQSQANKKNAISKQYSTARGRFLSPISISTDIGTFSKSCINFFTKNSSRHWDCSQYCPYILPAKFDTIAEYRKLAYNSCPPQSSQYNSMMSPSTVRCSSTLTKICDEVIESKCGRPKASVLSGDRKYSVCKVQQPVISTINNFLKKKTQQIKEYIDKINIGTNDNPPRNLIIRPKKLNKLHNSQLYKIVCG